MKKKFRPLVILTATLLTIAVLALILIIFGFIYVKKNIDYAADEELFSRATSFESTVFYGRDYSSDEYVPVKAEMAGSLRKTYIPLEKIPKTLIDGFISVEDRGFFEHSGVDYKRTAYAAMNYLFGKEKRFGASTITQQVIKNISGDNEVTVTRKISEILRALHIEKVFSKDEILELYLNIVPMSGNVYGICEASRLFFGKEPSLLTAAECATLIGITNAPTAYSPYGNPEKCLEKRNLVLDTMLSAGVIDEEECQRAKNDPLVVISENKWEDRFDSWFSESVIESVTEDLSKKYKISKSAARMMLLSGGYSVYTTMDVNAQRILEEYFENESRFERAKNIGADYSMVVLDSKNADVIALIGGCGEKHGNRLLNNALVPHIPASALKPLAIYAPLIDEGVINWATVVDDTPISFNEADGELVEYPKNSPDIYDGLITVKDAVRLSKNTVAMKLCKMQGERKTFEFLRNKLGMDSLVYKESKNGRTYSDVGLAPMALGQLTRGVSLSKLTECYTVFASGGVLNNSRNYIKVVDYEGKTVLDNPQKTDRIFSEQTAKIMNRLLCEVVNLGTAKSIKLKEIVDTAGKTGTSSGNKDKTFVGYTPYFTAGIWLGSDKGSVAGLAPTALSAWDEIMNKLHRELIKTGELDSFSTDGLLYLPYCKDSGEIFSENCLYDPRGSRMEYGYFTKENMPSEECRTHVIVGYDSVNKGVSRGRCPDQVLSEVSLIKVSERSFPKDIFVTDAEYVYKDISIYDMIPNSPTLPYFYYTLKEGEYVGKSKSKKQFNSACGEH